STVRFACSTYLENNTAAEFSPRCLTMSQDPEFRLACPYFVPENRCDAELWPHRARLPLGDGYEGHCSAPGHEGALPTQEELKSACNLGNACCERLPADRALDAV